MAGPSARLAICSLVEDGGTIFNGYFPRFQDEAFDRFDPHFTRPLEPCDAIAKTDALPADVTMISEVMKESGYVTGGIVSNGDLAPSFGFEQGYDEYQYLTPNTLIGAEESSSKLTLYNIFRDAFFALNKTYRVGDFYQDSGVVNEVAHDFLSQYRTSRFFLFLHYMDPHEPYFAHPYNGHAIPRAGNEHPDPLHAAEMRRLYQGESRVLRRELSEASRIAARLQDLRQHRDRSRGGPWRRCSRSTATRRRARRISRDRIHVPMLVKWAKNRVPVAVEHAARLIDVGPTLAAQAGATLPNVAQGLDLARGFDERIENGQMAFSEEDQAAR